MNESPFFQCAWVAQCNEAVAQKILFPPLWNLCISHLLCEELKNVRLSFHVQVILGFPQSICVLYSLWDAIDGPGFVSHYASNFVCHQVIRDVGKWWAFFFLFQARWQGSQQPITYTRGLCHGGEQCFLTYRCHMTPITTEQIADLAKSVIPKTRVLIFLLHLCMTYGLQVSGYSVSAQHLVFSGDCWRIRIRMVFSYLLLVLLLSLSCGLLAVRYSWLH